MRRSLTWVPVTLSRASRRRDGYIGRLCYHIRSKREKQTGSERVSWFHPFHSPGRHADRRSRHLHRGRWQARFVADDRPRHPHSRRRQLDHPTAGSRPARDRPAANGGRCLAGVRGLFRRMPAGGRCLVAHTRFRHRWPRLSLALADVPASRLWTFPRPDRRQKCDDGHAEWAARGSTRAETRRCDRRRVRGSRHFLRHAAAPRWLGPPTRVRCRCCCCATANPSGTWFFRRPVSIRIFRTRD